MFGQEQISRKSVHADLLNNQNQWNPDYPAEFQGSGVSSFKVIVLLSDKVSLLLEDGFDHMVT